MNITVNGHAEDRWQERWDKLGLVDQSISVERAYQESYEKINFPDAYGLTYYHPPTNMVLVVRDNRLRTVYPHVSQHMLIPDKFERCWKCTNLYDPTRTVDCPWCPWPHHSHE